VPNYKVTEIMARRLGKDYFDLLKAFEAQETQKSSGSWLVNDAHRWAARCLMEGSTSAIVTTNFDDCFEKALREANANMYWLTGDPHVDSDEIIERMKTDSRKLILVVNGLEACRFAQTMLPQLGGTILFLFKLHGSCYMPDSCIDTRLQRQQGLPSYSVDILDNLLLQSVFFVVCYSGGDMNDNTDYLRMVHNRRYARLVLLQKNMNKMEPGLRELSKLLNTQIDAPEGLCLIQGSIVGDLLQGDGVEPDFKETVAKWSQSLGNSWCKLVVLDLIELCGATVPLTPALEKLGFSDSTQQDWNNVLREIGETQDQNQVSSLSYRLSD
jgi:SIR2-like domain